MIVKAAFALSPAMIPIRLEFVRQYWEDNPSYFVESEAMAMGYQGA